jgi:adenine-specific DNA-methyltransferase
MKTKDLTQENISKLTSLFPELLTELEKDGKLIKTINVEKLKEIIGDFADDSDEVYELSWVGKQKSRQKIVKPINKTLRPIPEESVDFENTENLYIEGENFEVLKLLQESYLNKIKIIYIDPPYNTGNDFIYKDKYSMTKGDYEEEIGSIDEEGNKLFKNTITSGRFHSEWLSMMYERLIIAKDLLRDDGALFISIDDNEFENLKNICNEIFGKNNTKVIAVKMSEPSGLKMASVIKSGSIPKLKEYIIIAKKDGIKNLYFDKISKSKWDSEYNIFLKNFSKEDRNFIKQTQEKENITEDDISKLDELVSKVKLDSVSNILKQNNISKPETEEWLYGNSWRICQCAKSVSILELTEKKKQYNKNDLFFVKSATGNIYFVRANYSKDSKKPRIQLIFAEDNLEVHPGDFWSHIKTTGLDNEGQVPFKNGKKPLNLIKALINSNIGKDEDSVVLDFFSGSATTAHAVILLNSEKNLNLNYIMVQMEEDLDESLNNSDGEAKKNIQELINFLDEINKDHLLTEIGKERIRRAAKKIKEELLEKNKQQKLGEDLINPSDLDLGFRVFKLDSSNMKDVYYNPSEIDQRTLVNFKDNIKEDRTDKDLLYQVLLELAIPISAKIKEEKVNDKTIYRVNEDFLIACFDDEIELETVKKIAEYNPLRIVFKDSSFKDDSAKVNCDEYLKNKLPNTIVKVV